ncbi:HAMP domain-containing sensor histidine kinase [Flaviaesturariibacter amylovorans]|uniref:histidine kinase n=1 Tax=Flaviaesturariibacter amylovorans TaxID=1084520 RepID=A0ABP8GH82_9BACT
MPVRLRITLLFAFLVFLILGVVFAGVYYFSWQARLQTISTRLSNRAITTARLLSQEELFTPDVVKGVDSLTTLTYKRKVVQAYDFQNRLIYSYADLPGDSLTLDREVLNEARLKGRHYFTINGKEAIAYHHKDAHTRLVIVSAGVDGDGELFLSRLARLLLLTYLTAVILVLVSGYFFAGRLIRPVQRITADVADISAQNLARRLATGDTRDEWNELASTLNALLDRLQESFEMQQRFVANASHELFTPLTSLSSQLDVALQRERSAHDYRAVLASVYQDVQHMSKLTQTLLEFAKASGTRGGLEIQRVRIDEVLLRLPAEIAKADPGYVVTLDFEDLPEDEAQLFVYGNEALLFTAIRNLALNACKYSSDKQAQVLLRADGRQIRIGVSDNGIGIPREVIDKIFQPFFRVEENLAGGFGLGLSLTQRIIKLHKGSIEVASEVGRGTQFQVMLPCAW